MGKLSARLAVSFSAKVLVPVVSLMVLLLTLTVWTVNQRITRQFEVQARRRLATADAVFRSSQSSHTRYLLLRYRNVANEPRYKAVLQAADPPTVEEWLREILGEHEVDLILFTTATEEALASAKRDPLVSTTEFERGSQPAIHRALAGDGTVDTIRVGSRLFDIVAIPVFGTGGNLLGALTLGSEIGNAVAVEFSQATQSPIVLLANGTVIASTAPAQESPDALARLFTAAAAGADHGAPKTVLLGEEHYFCSAGKFASLSGDGALGYLLLYSYETSLRGLHETQRTLLLVSAVGILLGTAIVWWLVRRVTQPLRALSRSAEAVGQGDFTRRVEVTSRDECGELAAAFNRMTENLQRSRQQLESTVETLRTTQAQLIQSEKLSGIGEFVAGVAHELNNPLTAVMGFSELLKLADADPAHQRHLDLIHKSALRCQKIVQNLLSFARRHEPERKLASLNELVEGAVEFLHYQLRTSNIEVVTSLDPRRPKALVDPHQVQQVFLNIINNARQAIEAHQPSGCVRIATETCGTTARVQIQDNGPGIPPHHLSKVFDPFFTTKEAGKGTGLGLSLCYGIIKDHGGNIEVRSRPGDGATFVVELPLASETAGRVHEQTTVSTLASPGAPEGGGKRVLVIDDEDAILQMVRDTLAEQGYQVDLARDGESALRRITQAPYDLALCDWKMPGLNGQQVYERVRASNPALSDRMIFITGDVINAKAEAFLRDRKKICLSKPFSLVEFRSAVRKAIAAAG